MYAQALRVKNKSLLLVSVFQIVVGAIAVTFGSLALARGCDLASIAQGIWAGSIIILSGIFGVVAYCTESTCWIETYLWTSATSILLAAALVTIETVAYTFAFIDCRDGEPPACDETCLSYHRYLMVIGEFLQAACILAVVLAAKTLRYPPDDTIGVPYKKLMTDA